MQKKTSKANCIQSNRGQSSRLRAKGPLWAHYTLRLTYYVLPLVLLSACNAGQASRIEPTPTVVAQIEATQPAPSPAATMTPEPPASTLVQAVAYDAGPG
jgi:hypothetical protein